MDDGTTFSYEHRRDQALSHDRCFLCGVSLDVVAGTQEHVFAEWMQHAFDLWDQQLNLLNGTSIPYRNLRIPCCSPCNNEYLSRVERDVREAVEREQTKLPLWLLLTKGYDQPYVFVELRLCTGERVLSRRPILDIAVDPLAFGEGIIGQFLDKGLSSSGSLGAHCSHS